MKFIKHTKFYLIFSLILLIPGAISLALFGLNLAIDFVGGSVMEYRFEEPVENREEAAASIRDIFSSKEVVVKDVVFNDPTSVEIKAAAFDVVLNDEIKQNFTEAFPGSRQVAFETIGPSMGAETTKRAFFALVLASVGILLYIAYAFRNVPKPYSSFRFGSTALVAMVHDALIVLGLFSILGHFMNVEIDALFLTAVLTVIGFSVHDTIVVFDRIRENLRKLPSSWRFTEVVDYSIGETLNRSLATSLTVIVVLFSLVLLGGSSIKFFTLALLVGIISGTYSSIFNAAPLLVLWEERSLRKSRR